MRRDGHDRRTVTEPETDERWARLDEARLRRLIAVGRSFVQELDPEVLLDQVLAAAQDLTGARHAALGILDERRERLERFLFRGVDAGTEAAIGELPHGRGLLGVLIEEPAPLRLERLQGHPGSFGFPAGHPPMSSFLGVPIVVRGSAWGNLYLTEKVGGPFDAADQEALTILADWAAVALENARLYDELQRRHADSTHVNRILEATNAITRAVGTETDLDRVLTLIVERGRDLIDARTLVLSVPTGDELEIAAVAGEAGAAAPGTRIPLASSTTGEVLRTGRSRRVAAPDLGHAPSRLGIANARTSLLVPLIFRGRALGVIGALDRLDGGPEFTADDEALLTAFAASAATAVATAHQVSESRLREALLSAERERRRWARELHDETLQGLAGLRVQLSVTEQRTGDERTGAAIRAALAQLDVQIGDLRRLITELRPATLDELGLEPALATLAGGVARAGIDVDLQVDLQGTRLSPELETTVYRLTQEALTNVEKHAAAARCAIEVAIQGPMVTVVIRDDGRGFEPAALVRRTGLGVTGMRERVQLAGGTLHLAPGTYGGTELRATLPLER